jgi:hypothetical protein
MKVSKNFSVEEFIPKDTFKTLGARSIVLLDDRIIHVAQALREVYGSANINEWLWGANANFRGWRPFWLEKDGDTEFAEYSQHKFGRAIDLNFFSVSNNIVREEIRENQKFWYNIGIRRVENDTTHLHVDVGESGKIGEIYFFDKPIKEE